MENNMGIKDYLHLYLGCEIMIKGRGLTYSNSYAFIERLDSENYSFRWEDIKPILRPLSDMTKEEQKAVFGNFGQMGIRDAYDNYLKPEGLRFLLSRHFDLFGLIDAGLAIDKTKMTTNGK